MSDLSFDTHAEIRKLEHSGIPLPHAEALVDMVTRAPINQQVAETLEYLKFQIDTNMATKAEIADLSGSTKAEIATLRTDLYRALWLQGGALGTLILGLAAMILVFAGYTLTRP